MFFIYLKQKIRLFPYDQNSIFCFFHKCLAKISICHLVIMVIINFHQNPFIFMVFSIISFLLGAMYVDLGGVASLRSSPWIGLSFMAVRGLGLFDKL